MIIFINVLNQLVLHALQLFNVKYSIILFGMIRSNVLLSLKITIYRFKFEEISTF